MTEKETNQLREQAQYLAGKDITVHVTDEKGNVKRTVICTVLNRFPTIGIGEDGGELNYSISVIVLEKGTDKTHSLSLKEVLKQYPEEKS